MSKLQENFNAIIAKIEERIKDEEELEFIKKQIADISMLYIDELNKIMDLSERRVNQVYENQKILEQKLAQVEKGMATIEKELFIEDEYDFEITCPYCNHVFVADVDTSKKDIECPECHNQIELEWSGNEHEEACSGHCGTCGECGTEEIGEQNEIIEEDDIYEGTDDDDM